jgi:hypothetical protein
MLRLSKGIFLDRRVPSHDGVLMGRVDDFFVKFHEVDSSVSAPAK